MNWKKCRKRLNRVLGELHEAERAVNRETKELERVRRKTRTALKGQKVAQGIVQSVQQTIHNQLAAVVNKCLSSVFPDPYEFKFIFEQKRGKTEARPVFLRDGREVDPMTAAGGGPGDCAALALRIACLKLARPQKRSLLIMDEPFLSICEDYQELFQGLLQGLARDLNIQIILVSHTKAFQIGKVIQL